MIETLKAIQKSLRKNWQLILICLVVISGSFTTLFYHYRSWGRDDFVYKIESKIFDWKLHQRGVDKTPTKVGILAIDEKSLRKFGRWPFSRRYYARAFANLKKLGVKWIAFDAVWAEPEKTLLEDAKKQISDLSQQNLQDKQNQILSMIDNSPSDIIMTRGIQDFTNIIMGFFYFGSLFETKNNFGKRNPFVGLEHMADISELAYDMPEGKTLDDYLFLNKGYGVVTNTQLYNDVGEHFAFFSNDADDDAINRWVTLLANIDGKLMPSLSLKTAAEFLDRDIYVIFDDQTIEAIALPSREDEADSIEIPIDANGAGRILANHRGPGRAFHHFSLADAYLNKYTKKERKALKGSVLLLGATATGINDIRPNPFDPSIDGAENHAAALDNIIRSNYLKRPKTIYQTELLIVLIVGLLFAPLMIWGKAVISGIAVLMFLIGYYYFDKYVWFANGVWAYLFVPYVEILSMFVLTNLFKYITEEKDKKFLKSAFGSYISPELIDEMYSSGEPPQLGGTSGIITAYFTDIQGFSSFSEKLSATELVELLNEYLTAMTDILLENKGTLDKYEGDAIIAFFGAPMTLPDHAAKACFVALRMQETLLELRKKWASEGDKWPQIVKEMRMRIGINSGEIVTGNMGSRDRMNYTMMGDSVNLAARLEEAAKQYGIFTQVSKFTMDLTGGHFEMRELDTIRVVGKEEPVTTYDLLGLKGRTAPGLIKLKDEFHKGIALYKDMKWDEAIAQFQVTLGLEYERYPDLKGKKTNPSLVYIDRCKAYKENPPPDDWGGVYVLTSK
ncbi:MAG: CHASE2 domain-containing protein [Oligoflexales bacterium]